ncbi:MAG: ABC transporter ATP-binding protein/permease [Defluviitaleaceae bacterium]|nr:ABC transporter ATP-binding protein/permease [Defluviitaleaceae bacterium]
MDVMHWLWKNYVRPHRMKMVAAMFLVMVTSALAVTGPLIVGHIVDEVLEGGNLDVLMPLLIAMVAIMFIRMTIVWCFRMIFETFSQDATCAMRRDLYVKLHEMDFDYFSANKVGDIMAKMTGDVETVRHFIAWVVYSLFENFMWLSLSLIMLIRINVPLTLSLSLVAPILGFYAVRLVKEVRPTFADIRESFSTLNSVVAENIGGNRVVKAFAREDYEVEKFQKQNLDFREKNLISAGVWAKYLPVLDGLSSMLGGIVILVGGLFVINGYMTVGDLVIFNGYLWMLAVPMRMFGWLLNDFQRSRASLEKIKEMLDVKPKIPLEAIQTTEAIKGFVEFKNVSFHFEDDDRVAVLKNVSFKTKPGETVGILGETGSGKSTLVSLISRFYDAVDGEVLVDGKNVKTWNTRQLRDAISTVMQDVFLFSDTTAANIAFSNTSADMSQVKHVAKLADAHHFIEALSDGYDTIIGERGTGLSGGQKQRLSLARALLKDPSILILDDTTSAVDMETEYKIQQDLQKVGVNKTTFIIAHRVSSVKDADLILVLNKGEIIERGTHDTLMAKSGYYATVYNEQIGTQ